MKNRPILRVEDNDNDVRLTRRALQKSSTSNRFVVAGDGLAALDCLCANGGQVDAESRSGDGATFFFTQPEQPASSA